MARKPKTELSREEARAKAQAAEQDALLREVDEAVRQSDLEVFMDRFGKPLLGLVVLGLGAFGGYLWWDNRQEAEIERSSEQLVTAIDQLEAGNTDEADAQLAAIEGAGNADVSALMLRAGIAADAGEDDEAVQLLDRVIDDADTPEALRSLAVIRRTALRFDAMEPAEVVSAMQPLAVPGEPFYASAGELLAHAYLAQDKRDESGALFAAIAREENTPRGARARMLNMAGILGVDAVDDVQDVLEGQRADTPAQEPALIGE